MKIVRWTPFELHRDYPYTLQVESGCRIAPNVTVSEVPAGDGQSVTVEDDFIDWLQCIEVTDAPFGGQVVECEHSWSVPYQVNGKRWQCCIYCLEEREVQTNWRLEVVEQALQEDSQNER